MKKLLQRIMLLSMLVVNTQQTQAAWYSSWGEFQSAVSTQWNSFTDWVTGFFRKSPLPTQLGSIKAFFGRKISTEQALTDFLIKYKKFLSDLEDIPQGQKEWSDVIAANNDVVEDLDSINKIQKDGQFGIPTSINNTTPPEPTRTDLKLAFRILASPINWSDLKDTATIKNIRLPQPSIINLMNLLQQDRTGYFNEYLEKLDSLKKTLSGKPAGTKTNLPSFHDPAELLKKLRGFKISETMRLFLKNKDTFYEQLLNIYTADLNDSDPANKILWIKRIQ